MAKFLEKIGQIIIKFLWIIKTLTSVITLKIEKQSWRHHASRLQTILYTYSNKKNMVFHGNRYIYQWKRIKNPEINSQIITLIIKEPRIHNGKEQSLK